MEWFRSYVLGNITFPILVLPRVLCNIFLELYNFFLYCFYIMPFFHFNVQYIYVQFSSQHPCQADDGNGCIRNISFKLKSCRLFKMPRILTILVVSSWWPTNLLRNLDFSLRRTAITHVYLKYLAILNFSVCLMRIKLVQKATIKTRNKKERPFEHWLKRKCDAMAGYNY